MHFFFVPVAAQTPSPTPGGSQTGSLKMKELRYLMEVCTLICFSKIPDLTTLTDVIAAPKFEGCLLGPRIPVTLQAGYLCCDHHSQKGLS